MGVKKNVFGSNKERNCFRKLNTLWGKDYHIYHNLPFLNVLTGKDDLFGDDGQVFTLNEEEYNLLKKTSIDFTLCDKKDTPILCIEFDGMQNGYNIGTKYYNRNKLSDRKARRDILELKLRVAHGSLFPFFILGSEEFRGLSGSVRLTIADGIIGEVLSAKAAYERINAGFDPQQCGFTNEEFELLSPNEAQEIMEDWIAMIEIESDFKYNPIIKEVARLSSELHVNSYSNHFGSHEQSDSEKWLGMECSVTSTQYGTSSVNIRIPRYKTPFCYFPINVAESVGRLLALEKLRRKKSE